MKVVYCLNSIVELGGIAKVTILKANELARKGFEVYILVSDHNNKQTQLNSNVKLINLNINYYKDDWKSYFHVLKGIIIKRKQHKNKLKKILNQIQPDVVISVGQSEKYFLPYIKGPWKTIREFHYDKLYRIRSANNFFQKFIARIVNFYDLNFIIKKFNKIVVLTNEDKIHNWINKDNVFVIPNPIVVKPFVLPSFENKKIVAVGRLVEVKNYRSMICAFKKVAEKHPDWILEIWGEGNLKIQLQNEISNLNLKENIILKGTTDNLNEIYGNASLLLMTSKYEGWGLVLTEAMSYSIPVISYDCPYGPKEIVEDGINGFLIPSGKENLFAEKICFFIENPEVLKDFCKKANVSIRKFDIDKIMNKWIEVFN